MWGDLVHSAALQCPVPEITVAFDADEQQARATRADLFARASRERFLVCGAHLPFPGVGWIDAQEGGGYLFDPLRAS
jgi:glyoxylase-like metal-dependent hydrolase (beta-lactamase superfamily II)